MNIKTIFTALLLSFFSTCFAQTGSFSTTISVNGNNRTLACFVPVDYDANKPARLMVCLHGAGDNAENYCNALVKSFNWPSLYPNTIFICPDGGDDRSKDFYQPAGDQVVITKAIAYGHEHYNIASGSTILQGFSLGGRSALKFGLDHSDSVTNLLLNTPAIQGQADLDNKIPSSLGYQFNKASQLRIFLTVGADDYTYFGTVGQLAKILKMNDADIHYQAVPGLAHGLPAAAFTTKSKLFFDQVNQAAMDAEIFDLQTTEYVCGGQFKPTIYIRNNGDSSLKELNIYYEIGNQHSTYNWVGNLLPNKHLQLQIPISVALEGIQDLKIHLQTQNFKDADTLNNNGSAMVEFPNSNSFSQLIEGFEATSPQWRFKDDGSLFGWYIDTDVKKSGKASVGTFNTILLFNTLGYRQTIQSPITNLKALTFKELSFDVAFNYHRYTAPYVTKDTDFADTLEIQISTDCGATYTTIYRKGGKDLATVNEPILNPLSVAACFFTPKAGEWRKERIDLSAFAQIENAVFRMNYISGLGGCINIDNINVGANSADLGHTIPNTTIKLYPNPATSIVSIEGDFAGLAEVKIMDSKGSLVATTNISNQANTIDVSGFTAGIYVVEITSNSFHGFQKLYINK